MAYFRFGKLLPEKDLATRIIIATQKSRLPCHSFDILRIGDAPLQDCELPVKLLIKVEPDQVDWVDGIHLARRCRSELQRFGLGDTDCLLTCRHVLAKDENDDTINWVSTVNSTNREQPMQVLQSANHEEIKQNLATEKDALQKDIEKVQDKEAFAKTESTSRYLAHRQQELKHLDAFLAYYDYHAEDRKIGYIIASPPISAKIQPSGQTIRRDWAAIRIDQWKFHLDDKILPKNQFCSVDLDRTILHDLKATGQTLTVEGCHTLSTNYRRDKDMLATEKYIPVDSLQHQVDMIQRLNDQIEDDTQPFRLDVFKSGFQSGTTHGYLNEIGSYIRDGLSYSQNLCILSQGNHAFSKKGDSGSLISMLCRPGNDKTHDPVVVAAALLWGGCNHIQKTSMDITYAISLEHILKDVKQFFRQLGTDVDKVEICNLDIWEPTSATMP